MTKTRAEIEALPFCKNCGLRVENVEGEWEHADGHVPCPPGFGATASPEAP